jgi:hypothetical protein
MFLEMFSGFGEEVCIASEFIDDEAESVLFVGIREEIPSADNLGEGATSFYVGDEYPFSIYVVNSPEVGDVTIHQVYLDGAASTFEDENVAMSFPVVERRAGGFPGCVDRAVVFLSGKVFSGLTEADDL